MQKNCSEEFWKILWSHDHKALNILTETIETKPNTSFAIKIKSRQKTPQNSKLYSFGDTLKLLKCIVDNPKQMHTPHHIQLTVERAKRSHNSETAG